jgi:hypothetical protein
MGFLDTTRLSASCLIVAVSIARDPPLPDPQRLAARLCRPRR